MKYPKVRKDLVATASITSVFLVLSFFQYHMDKFFPGIPVKLIIYIFLGLMVILLLMQVSKIVRRKRKMKGNSKLKWIYYGPSFILLAGIIYFFSPFKLRSEILESPVILRGCYQGGTDQAVIRFRKNNHFEVIWTNEDGNEEWYPGIFVQKKDTFFLTFDEKSPETLGSKIVNNGVNLVSEGSQNEEGSKHNYVLFTIGYCRDNDGNFIH
ncbi:MAG: hypothetical protein JST81_01440 [Bacteroidetes bacterium]|jgi:hypothetical protein|nr:hypothetical protein [Bacteroidota bacterium]